MEVCHEQQPRAQMKLWVVIFLSMDLSHCRQTFLTLLNTCFLKQEAEHDVVGNPLTDLSNAGIILFFVFESPVPEGFFLSSSAS